MYGIVAVVAGPEPGLSVEIKVIVSVPCWPNCHVLKTII